MLILHLIGMIACVRVRACVCVFSCVYNIFSPFALRKTNVSEIEKVDFTTEYLTTR